MNCDELAARLAAANDVDRKRLLEQNPGSLNSNLAQSLKSLFDEEKHGDPRARRGAADALKALADITNEPLIEALSVWTEGIVLLQIGGQAEESMSRFDLAEAELTNINMPLLAAATQVNKIHALLILGKYDDALECGLRARGIFLEHKDELRAGQIEQNLGSVYFRRDRYQEAERFYRSARERFLSAGDQKQLTEIEVCLATALIFQHRFRDAQFLYEEALKRSETNGLVIAQAVIECDLGCLALFRGRYDQALDYLERSRRRYSSLGMTHESAIAEQEQAEAYLDLNLAREAADIYERIIPTFAELGMRAEQARSLLYYARACLALARVKEASKRLADARTLFAAEGNRIGEALVRLVEAQLLNDRQEYGSAYEAALDAEVTLAEVGTWSRALIARWLRGEAARSLENEREAREIFRSALRDSESNALPQIAQRCHTSLGLLDAKAGNIENAEASFKRAISIVEELRSLLPSDEFRTAFVTDKQTPYTQLVKLSLSALEDSRAVEALSYVERAKSRALVDMMSGALQFRVKPRDGFEAELVSRLDELREELKWFYSQIDRSAQTQSTGRPESLLALRGEVREREGKMLEIMRQLQQRAGSDLTSEERLDVPALQRALGTDTAIVEYFAIDGVLLAFVVTADSVEVVHNLGRESDVAAAVDLLRFQTNSLRFNTELLQDHLGELTSRTQRHLKTLYDILLRPLEDRLGQRRLVVVPFRSLHYIPFQALYDGERYLVEHREVCYAPSAGVLLRCLAIPRRSLQHAVLFGVADQMAPKVRDEVAALSPLFPSSVALIDEQATLDALHKHASSADVLHLACHGQFRPDNPLFSSLKLSDGWLTARDAYDLDLNCSLVTLSACETGISAVAPGDEIMGLARGFFSAGAPSLLVSLWTVDDEATAELMTRFYSELLAGQSPAAALRQAELKMLARHQHPFFWSPFVLLGHW